MREELESAESLVSTVTMLISVKFWIFTVLAIAALILLSSFDIKRLFK